MGGAPSEDLLDHYAADVDDNTQQLILSAASGALVRIMDPGRYLIQVLNMQGTSRAWIRFGVFGKVAAAIAAVPCMPLDKAGIIAFEINIRMGHNDGLTAILGAAASAPAETIYVTRISRRKSRVKDK